MSETVNTATTGVYQEPSTTETRQLWFLNERGGTPDIGIKAVWEDYRGDGVHVAVFDSMVAFPFQEWMPDDQFDYMIDAAKETLEHLRG